MLFCSQRVASETHHPLVSPPPSSSIFIPYASSSSHIPEFQSRPVDPKDFGPRTRDPISPEQSPRAINNYYYQISRSAASSSKRKHSEALGDDGVPKTPKNNNKRWSKSEEDHLVTWWTDPDNYTKFKNPLGFQPGLTKSKIQHDLAAELNERFGGGFDYKQIKNKMDGMEKQYKAARHVINITGNGDQPGRSQALKDRVMKKCPFYYAVERVWSTDIRNDPIEPMESIMNTDALLLQPDRDEDEDEPVATDHAATEYNLDSEDADTLADNESVIVVGDERRTSKAKKTQNGTFMDRLDEMSGPAVEVCKIQEETKRQLAAEETTREKARLALRERELAHDLAYRERQIEMDRKDSRDRERTKRLRDKQQYDNIFAKAKEATKRRELRVREAEINLRLKELESRADQRKRAPRL
ncbi:hypothetical protein BG004_003459 [Podila humilis]|nr:hypothetical protein BG004_003459 [Podila humilis]